VPANTPLIRLDAETERVINEFANDQYDLADWDKFDHDSPLAALTQRARASRAALRSRILKLQEIARKDGRGEGYTIAYEGGAE